jgi:uncharacterized protein YqeY
MLKNKIMIKEQINKDYMTAFKAKNTVAKNLLSVVKGEIQTIEKNTSVENMSDEDVLKILQKSAKSLRETISSLEKTETGMYFSNDLVSAREELSIIESYLPKQMSKEEVTTKVTELKNSGVTNIGSIMKEFASLPVDKKMVSEVIKEVIN